ncbi:MAG: hypothetical protein IAE97_10505 [Chthoniobacterales bacterium]|nr:hypothetical protein [Chthoniobacterales bacterium]
MKTFKITPTNEKRLLVIAEILETTPEAFANRILGEYLDDLHGGRVCELEIADRNIGGRTKAMRIFRKAANFDIRCDPHATMEYHLREHRPLVA